jgi:hypothetical protein
MNKRTRHVTFVTLIEHLFARLTLDVRGLWRILHARSGAYWYATGMMNVSAAPVPDLQGLIERQSVEIELLRAQIAAFTALAHAIATGGIAQTHPVESVIRRDI